MIFSDSIEVAIGLAFIFTMLSLVLTTVNELIETVTKTRSRFLFAGIAELLSTPASATPTSDDAATPNPLTVLFSHPQLQGLIRGDLESAKKLAQLPSYLPARNVAQALLDKAMAGAFSAATTTATLPSLASGIDRLRLAAERVDNPQLRQVLIGAAEAGRTDLASARQYLEQWYASATDRISGRYKRRTHRLLFCLGLLVAVFLNVNTLSMAGHLAGDANARRAMVEQAGTLKDPAAVKDAVARIGGVGLPIGWSDKSRKEIWGPITCAGGCSTVDWALGWTEIIAGFLLTAFAVTLGAPFWFDVLNRLMVIRATVKPAEKSKEEASEDRQTGSTKERVIVTAINAGEPMPPQAAPDAVDTDVYNPDAPPRLLEDDEEQAVEPAVAGEPA